MWLKIKVCG